MDGGIPHDATCHHASLECAAIPSGADTPVKGWAGHIWPEHRFGAPSARVRDGDFSSRWIPPHRHGRHVFFTAKAERATRPISAWRVLAENCTLVRRPVMLPTAGRTIGMGRSRPKGSAFGIRCSSKTQLRNHSRPARISVIRPYPP